MSRARVTLSLRPGPSLSVASPMVNGRLLALARAVRWCAGPRRTDEHPPAVRQQNLLAVGLVLTVLRAIAFDDDGGAGFDGIHVPAAPEHRVGRSALDRPPGDLA